MLRIAIKTAAFAIASPVVLWHADGPADYAVGLVFAAMVLIQGLNWLDEMYGNTFR